MALLEKLGFSCDMAQIFLHDFRGQGAQNLYRLKSLTALELLKLGIADDINILTLEIRSIQAQNS